MRKRLTVFAMLILAAAAPLWAADIVDLPVVAPVEEGLVSSYRIGPGDQLGIEVWKDQALTRLVTVLPDGKISFPLIGELKASGKTVAQLKKEIEEKIARYVPDSVLTIEVKQTAMQIYVLGRVNQPGRTFLTTDVNILQALAIAGGPNPFANRSRIRVLRQEGGKTSVFPFNYDEVTSGRQLDTNIELKRGDVVFVP